MQTGKFIQAQSTNNGYKLTLSGDLSLNNNISIKAEFDQYINKKGAVQIVLQDVDNFDLGIFQIIHSFIATKRAKGDPVNVKYDLQPEHQQLAENCGILIDVKH